MPRSQGGPSPSSSGHPRFRGAAPRRHDSHPQRPVCARAAHGGDGGAASRQPAVRDAARGARGRAAPLLWLPKAQRIAMAAHAAANRPVAALRA